MSDSVLYEYGADSPLPEGYAYLLSDKQRFHDSSDTTKAGLEFHLATTVGPTALSLTGDAKINFSRNVLETSGCFVHEITQNLNDPTDVYEIWSRSVNVYSGSVVTTGGLGTFGNELTTVVSQNTYSYGRRHVYGIGSDPSRTPAAGGLDQPSAGLSPNRLGHLRLRPGRR